MPKISYVYPNVGGIAQRGGLLERWALAEKAGCTYVEVPADFIKNRTEVKKTNLDLCSFLDPESIAKIYNQESSIPPNLKYILHTEPSLPRTDGYGISHQARLKWHDNDWVKSFTRMMLDISIFFGLPPAAIEIHPGDRRNTYQDIANGVSFLLEGFKKEWEYAPLILLENRTGQFISNGFQIQDFWACIQSDYQIITKHFGIVLDIQQLYTVSKESFIDHLKQIPIDSVQALHIHSKHRPPSFDDAIPWRMVFNFIQQLKGHVIINPEIHHKNRVETVIDFCSEFLVSTE